MSGKKRKSEDAKSGAKKASKLTVAHVPESKKLSSKASISNKSYDNKQLHKSKPSRKFSDKKSKLEKDKETQNVKPKRDKSSKDTQGNSATPQKTTKESSSPHPFDWDPADDCETSIEAYRTVAPFLKKLAQRLKKPKSELIIYDPYYCQGGVAKHLAKLGFTKVYNKNEDFYKKMELGQLPPHDVLLTSPPYSKNHIQRLLEYVSTSTIPWILLMPDYVHRKQYYGPLIQATRPFYVVPDKPYTYMGVSGGRSANIDVPCRHWERSQTCPKGDKCMFHHGTSTDSSSKKAKEVAPAPVAPFHSLWHMHFGQGRTDDATIQWWQHKFGSKSNCKIVRDVVSIDTIK